MASVTVYCDIITNRLVKGLANSDAFSFPKLYQGSAYPISFVPVTPTYARTGNQFTALAVSSMTLEVGVGPSAGSESLYAYQGTFVESTISGTSTACLNGTLDLNTTELNTAVGSNFSLETFFEIRLNDNGDKRVVWQQPAVVYAVTIGPTGAVTLPSSSEQYYTKAELDALFVKFVNNETASRGKTITVYSPDGSHSRVLGVDNDANPIDFNI